MANKIKPRLIIVLTIVMICSTVTLTFLRQLTTPIIEAHAEKKKEESILKVLPDSAKEYKKVTKDGLTLYKGLDKSGNIVGYAFQNSGQGFQSILKIMMGLDLENNKIIKVRILNQAETPGLGSRIKEETFKDQYKGKSFSDQFKVKEDIDSISGATITSVAMTDVIKEGIEKVQKVYGGGE